MDAAKKEKRNKRWILWLLTDLLLLIPIGIILLIFGQIIDEKRNDEESPSIVEETSFIQGGIDHGIYSFDTGDGNASITL